MLSNSLSFNLFLNVVFLTTRLCLWWACDATRVAVRAVVSVAVAAVSTVLSAPAVKLATVKLAVIPKSCADCTKACNFTNSMLCAPNPTALNVSDWLGNLLDRMVSCSSVGSRDTSLGLPSDINVTTYAHNVVSSADCKMWFRLSKALAYIPCSRGLACACPTMR